MNRSFFICLFLASFLGKNISAQSDHILEYNKPAEYFEESLVLGNGRIGASVFGGVSSDKIYLNDITLWTGEPVNANINPNAYKNLPAIRTALQNEDYKAADSLNKKLQGKYSESYAPLGTMFIEMQHAGNAEKYYRELDISKAVSETRYTINSVKYTRTYFVSHPDNVFMILLNSSKKGALNFDLKFSSLLKYTISTAGNIFKIKGYAPVHADPSYLGNHTGAIVFDEKKGTHFTTLFKIKSSDGIITNTDSTLSLKNGTNAEIYVSIATSFNGFDKNPATEGLNDEATATTLLTKVFNRTENADLIGNHIKDYKSFYDRVKLNLDLGTSTAPHLPTDERLKRYATGSEDKNLETLYFNYGRYLLISSSRTKGVPANLQGLWNPYLRPPWSSNYTLNINAEENYWLAENTNLSEMHTPFLSFIKNLSKTGATTAKNFYGASGWTAAHNSDIWAMSYPVGNFGQGGTMWSNWNMGGAWLSTHLWEHFNFTHDTTFLKNEGYPLMRGASQFCLDWLIADKNGQLITSPSTSPENVFITDTGFKGATLYGGTADLAMIRELLMQSVQAATVLNTDADFKNKMVKALAQLHPYQIGKKGNLQEWYYDWEDAEPQHRHQSHLFGLFPGHQITPNLTPALADACKKTLEIKGDETTGWSKGWRINLWARLWDGNHAYKMYRELLKYVDPDGVKTSYARGGGTYPNLFDAHPPFQIDGNFGGAAAVVEMLLQSGENEIRLLPALPDAWNVGSIKGICARGGFEIDMEWHNKILTQMNISSKTGGSTTLIYGNKQKKISLQKGKKIKIIW